MADTSETERARLRLQTTITLGLVALYTVAILAYYVWTFRSFPVDKVQPASWGVLGDYVGGLLNPIVALLALYWLTRSIGIQQTELTETRKSLNEQGATFEKQRFEDTFFALLNQHNKVLDRLSAPDSTKRYSLSTLEQTHSDIFSRDAPLEEKRDLFGDYDSKLGHYFRILYHLLKLIATRTPGSTLGQEFTGEAILATAPSVEEKLYANLVRAFLGVELTQLLAVNCYCDPDSTYWRYKCLIERYEFLEHMPLFINNRSHIALEEAVDFYRRSAFGNSEFVADAN